MTLRGCIPFLVALSACSAPQRPPPSARSAPVTITRDDWGIAHVRGRTDADAVFGMIYAQAEDDFPRIEQNYLVALGRRALADGEEAIWQDLRQRLYVSDDGLRAHYAASPPWLKKLMDAWAAGLNAYLSDHPNVHPRVLTRFEPWMALSFTEGSIGGDIERISLSALRAFYDPLGRKIEEKADADAVAKLNDERSASNGIAIAPSRTAAHRSLLLINPHTSFFFRSELQMSSDEGLDVYGAVTWGQLFVYQGWNARLGFMHTSSGVDSVDEFAETIVTRGSDRFYRYGTEERPLTSTELSIPYRTPQGSATRRITVYRTHHGPIVRADSGKWIAFAMMDKPVPALSQSFLRTKARSFDEYMRVMELRANSSNNTVYADADGVIAYLHPQFVPKRDDRFDYRKPVDGSDPAADWSGEHALTELPNVVRPATGYVQNTNDWPYAASGSASPSPERFPKYMEMHGANPRGVHATRLVESRSDFTLEALERAAFDSHMPGFARMVPVLLAAYDARPVRDLTEPIATLRSWDHRWATDSIATTLAVTWGEELVKRCARAKREPFPCAWDAAQEPVEAFADAVAKLVADFGTWRKPWGDVNRYQRVTSDLVQPFDDSAPSHAVAFTPGAWGSLASFATVTPPGMHKRYGTSGNSFVAVVELGKEGPRALAVTAGGESGHVQSPHFSDQVERYRAGALRPVYFRPSDLEGHTERVLRLERR
jgi:acyl-homoserine-lactone acylase